MQLVVNGEFFNAPDGCKLAELLLIIGLSDEKVMACAVNGVIVKKNEWSTFVLTESNSVELLNFVGGG